jgi:hypothetical protein
MLIARLETSAMEFQYLKQFVTIGNIVVISDAYVELVVCVL